MDHQKETLTGSGWSAEIGNWKIGGKPRTGRVRDDGSNWRTGSGLAPVHRE